MVTKQIHNLWWPITATAITRTNTLNKENLTNKKVLPTYKKGLLPYKQDLLTYTKKRFAYKYQKPTPSSRSKHFHGKFLQQILAANSYGKFLLQIPTTNSRICNAEDGVE